MFEEFQNDVDFNFSLCIHFDCFHQEVAFCGSPSMITTSMSMIGSVVKLQRTMDL